MIKNKKKLTLARETVVMLSKKELHAVQGGVHTIPNSKCEPSGVIACPTQ